MTAAVACLVTVAGGVTFQMGAAAAQASQPTDSNIFVACGYGETVSEPSCLSLSEAYADVLKDNAASAPAATIELQPGDYCPIDLTASGTLYRTLTIVGIGIGSENTSEPIEFDGPEASISTFQWSSTYCTSAGSGLVNIDNDGYGQYGEERVTLQNLTLDGGANGSTTGEPSDGLYDFESTVYLRDVIVENATGIGIDGDSEDYGSTIVQHSAIIDNGEGALIDGGGIYDSTVAGSSGYGISAWQFTTFSSDTVTGNDDGFESPGGDSDIQVDSSIIADNTTDCPDGSSWGLDGSGYDLIGTSCGLSNPADDGTDVGFNGTWANNTPGLNGGPTPSVEPPAQAASAASTLGCEDNPDQREYLWNGTDCDLGSVNTTGSGTSTAVRGGSGSLGSYHSGDSPVTGAVSATNTAGGLVNVFSVAVSGPFTVTEDTCTWAILAPASSCSVDIAANGGGAGALRGKLTVDTDGDFGTTLIIQLSATELPPRPSSITIALSGDPTGEGDCGTDPSDCSLRQALDNIAGGGTITVPAGTYALSQGALDVESGVTIAGAGAGTTTVNGGGSGGVFEVDYGKVTISGLTITNGSNDSGGGIYNDATLTLLRAVVVGNIAADAGGGIENESTMIIEQSTVSGNSVSDTTSGYIEGGGGIDNSGALSIVNSTVAGNSSGYGGGVFSDYGGDQSAAIEFSTVASNTATEGGGGIYADTVEDDGVAVPPRAGAPRSASESIVLADTALAGNTAPSGTGDCEGTIVSGGHNLASDTSCHLTGAGDLGNTRAQLGALSSNGGHTKTMLPAASSPLVNAASDTDCKAVPTDQRGVKRPQGPHCDIGAVEVVSTPQASNLTRPTAAVTITHGLALTVSSKLTDSVLGEAIAGAKLVLKSRHGTSGSFTDVTSATTSASGVASVSVKPGVNTQLEWVFAGSSGHLAATSQPETVSVAPVVEAYLLRTHGVHPAVVTVYGTLAPQDAGQQVVLEILVGSSWKATKATAVISSQVMPNGHTEVGYVLERTETTAGTYKFRVRRAATSTNVAGLSRQLTFTVT
ncbi:MAG: choice-of-anchor Q domain-containing protein [Acidimicrobiales bacterium]